MGSTGMILYTPEQELVRRIQQSEGAYYFSRAFDLVLRKHGLIQAHAADDGDPTTAGYGFVTRGTPWQEAFRHAAIVFEGPLHPTVTAALGLATRDDVAEVLSLCGEELPHHVRVGYSSFTVRRIPRNVHERSDPFDFVCDDSLWNRRRFGYQQLTNPGTWKPVLAASACDETEPVTVGLASRQYLVLSVPLFDLFVHQHTFPPLADAGYYAMVRDFPTFELERWLIERARRLFVGAGHVLLQVNRWPAGYRAAFSIRHDFDRPISDEQLQDIVLFHGRNGYKATWFWMRKTFARPQIDTVDSAGHEIALHSEAHTPEAFASDEVDFFRTCQRIPVNGMTAHGGGGAIGYLGHRHHQWCEGESFLYGEMLGKHNILPHAAVTIKDALPVVSPLVLPVAHQSLDAGMDPAAHNYEYLRRALPLGLAAGGHYVLMHHPDIHVPQLKRLLAQLPRDGVWAATLEEVCRWVQLAKLTSQVRYAADRLEMRFAGPLPNSVEFVAEVGDRQHIHRLPEGTVAAAIDRSSGMLLHVETSSGAARHSSGVASVEREAPSLARVTDALQRHILDWFARQNNGDVTAGNLITAGFNSVKVPKRFAQLMGPHYDWLEGSARPRILDVGCGYGGIALYLAARYPTAAVTATDVSDRFYRAGKDAAIEVGLRNVAFASQNVLDLDYEEQFDLVLLSNILCYVVTHDQLQRACRNAWRALRPGGCLVIHTAHLWSIREPFTSIPGLQFLPRAGRDLLARKTGRRSTMRDIRLPSWRELRRILTHLGACRIDHRPRGALALLRAKHLTAWATK